MNSNTLQYLKTEQSALRLSVDIGKVGLALIVALLLENSDNALAQTGANAYFNPPTALSGKTVIIPVGTTFEGRIDTTIGSSVSKQGERFVIEITSPALANGSEVLIPAGSQILGEIVQAVPSNKVRHDKKEKPFGQLRIQISGLKFPDGATFPMVASLVGEDAGGGSNPNLGGGMAYAGSSNNYEAVSPARMNRVRNRTGVPHVVTKQELMKDPIYGKAGSDHGQYGIRSLVKRKRNLFIYQGSPLTVRLDAPFKIGIGISRNAGASLEAPVNPSADDSPGSGHRRFSPASDADPSAGSSPPPAGAIGGGIFGSHPPIQSPPGQPTAAPGPAPTPLPFQVPAKNPTPQNGTPDSNF
jgi:hypothetical protein